MYHGVDDGNGASTSFFWLPLDRSKSLQQLHQSPVIQRLNNKYTLFAYVVEGNDILQQLQPGDILDNARVEEGVWKLIQPDSFGMNKIVETNEE